MLIIFSQVQVHYMILIWNSISKFKCAEINKDLKLWNRFEFLLDKTDWSTLSSSESNGLKSFIMEIFDIFYDSTEYTKGKILIIWKKKTSANPHPSGSWLNNVWCDTFKMGKHQLPLHSLLSWCNSRALQSESTDIRVGAKGISYFQ